MPEGDRYVTNGALLRCDKGVLITPLTVLPRPSRVNGQFQANALDCLPVVNIKPFGVCAITRAPCMPVMPFWTQVHAGALKVGGAPPLLESSVCQCGLGGRIGITVLSVPGAPPVGPEGVGGLAALQEQQRQQDAATHELANHAKEQAGKLALLGLACAIGGLFFPPLELVAVVALEASEAYLVAGIAIDVAVAIDHPTQDNWVTVGGDVVAVALGYVVGKVVVGRMMSALTRRFGPAAGEEVAAETAAETLPAAVEVPLPEGIEADPRGVYGYMAKPGSDFEKFDFSNPEVVAKGRAERFEYLSESQKIDQDVAVMRADGKSSEEIGRHVTEVRNQQKVAIRAEMDPADVAKLEARNMKKYGNPVGPTADDLFEETNSWEEVIAKATRKNEALNMLLGIPPKKP